VHLATPDGPLVSAVTWQRGKISLVTVPRQRSRAATEAAVQSRITEAVREALRAFLRDHKVANP
jgi:hypothetical protein